MLQNLLKPVILPFLFFSFFSCEEADTGISGDPSELMVQVTVDDTGMVIIEATAKDAVEYQFRIGDTEEPEQVNTTGIFQHTFEQSGIYSLDVRAYGASGRYIREIILQPVAIAGDIVSPEEGYVTPISYEGYDLIWFDEFNSSQVNSDFWTFEIGDGCPNLCGWGNNELQYYTNQNVTVEDGILTIEAREENMGGRSYTSTRMKTQDKFSFRYGRVDIRALLPQGQGIWPALWMLGDNITSVSWPACGEIDIMEMVGGQGRENTVHGTLHWDNNGHTYTGNGFTLPSGDFTDEFHVFSIVWDESQIRWMVNDVEYASISTTANHMSEFHSNFFFIFNVAVGGNWPGNPDSQTVFPQQMKVDYIRVFQPN